MTDTSRLESSATRSRGVQRPWDPRVWGTIIGAVGATVFVMANRAVLPVPWPTVSLVVWGVALLCYLTLVFVVPRTFGDIERVGAAAGFVYLGSVAGMLLVIRLGTTLLDSAGRDDLRPSLIVLAVGLHFLPFAAAFHTPMFTVLGGVMAALGASGLALGWWWDERAAAAVAVLSGVAMLVIIAGDALRGVRTTS